MLKPNSSGRFGAISLVVSLLLCVGIGLAILNHQRIIDYYVASTFQPGSSVNQLMDQTEMTDKASFLLRAAQVELSDRNSFNKNCAKKDAESVVLGCYIGPQHVYVYDVTDPRLEGVRQVTLAHEMLHAAYERLSETEKDRVGTLLDADLPQVLAANPELAERLKTYEKIEPGERYNELHSIIGTEAVSLGFELENYYKQYFDDRSAVVKFAGRYTKVFADLKNNQTQLVNQLKAMKMTIDSQVAAYNAGIESLNADIDSFNTRASTNGGFSSQTEFNGERASLIARREQLETEQISINGQVKRYNEKRDQLLALNVQAEDLNSRLDSTKLPPL